MVVGRVTVGIGTRLPATAGMLFLTVLVFVVVVFIFADAAIAGCTGRFSLRSTATPAVRFGDALCERNFFRQCSLQK